LSAGAQTPAGRFVITGQSVASAMTAAGWKITGDQVRFLSQVTANRPDARLQVVHTSRGLQGALTVELRCHDRSACLPFYVVITGAGAAGTSDPTAVSDGDQSALLTTAQKPLLRTGDPATLVFADKALRISMPVICLQNGHQGQKIRVASTDHRRFFKAEIVGPGLLRAITL